VLFGNFLQTKVITQSLSMDNKTSFNWVNEIDI